MIFRRIFTIFVLSLIASAASAITIDGKFDDWKDVLPAGSDKTGDVSFVDPIDWKTLWVKTEPSSDGSGKKSLFISYETSSWINFASNAWRYNIFIDSDNNIATGYRSYSNSFKLGADYLFQGASLYRYTGSGTNWSWAYCASYAYGISGSRFEAAIPESALGLGSGYRMRLFLHGENPSVSDYANETKEGFIFPNDIYLWLKFDNSVSDSSGRGVSASAIYNTAYTAGISGQAVSFDGINSYITLNTSASLSAKTDFSIEAWIKTSSDTEQTIIQQRNGGYNGEYQLMVTSSGNLKWWSYGDYAYGFNFTSKGKINDDKWHYVSAIRQNGAGILYIDGIFDSSQNSAARNLDSNIKVAIGRDIRDNNKNFKGLIDEIKIYPRALTQDEIASEYAKAKSDTTPPTPPIITDDGTWTTSKTTLHAVWTASLDAESNIKEYFYSIGTEKTKTDVLNWTSAAAALSATKTTLSLIEGRTYYFNVKAMNSAGLTSQITSSDGITIDSTPPTGAITINNGVSYTNSRTVTLDLSAADAVSGTSWAQFSDDNITYLPLENYTASKSWTLPLGDGAKTVYVKFKDKAGNISSAFSDTITLDTTAPTVTITTPQDGFITSASTITVSGMVNETDAAISVQRIAFSGQRTACGGTADSGQADTQFSSQITLSEGANTITVQATDLAGNVSSCQTITVRYEPAPPAAPLAINITSPSDGAYLNTPSITVEGVVTASDATISVQRAACGGTAGSGQRAADSGQADTQFSFQITLLEGDNVITATASKGAETASDTITVTLDTEPPVITIFTPDASSTTRSSIVYGTVSDDTVFVSVQRAAFSGQESVSLPDLPHSGMQSSNQSLDSTNESGNDNQRQFIARPSLSEGANTITIEARDRAGNTTQANRSFIYNNQTPKVTITSPQDNTEINVSPMIVDGTNTEDIQYVSVQRTAFSGQRTADSGQANTHFSVLVSLNPLTGSPVNPLTLITAFGYDADNNKHFDAILITTPGLMHYDLTKISGDAGEDNENRPVAGGERALNVRLNINDSPSANEEIVFSGQRTAGSGQADTISVYTDINGEAIAVIATSTDSNITNQIECCPVNNPSAKVSFLVDTKPALPSILTKITDTITPVPGAAISLIVQLTDLNNNPIQDETIIFSVQRTADSGQTASFPQSSSGNPDTTQAQTNYYGAAKVILTCPNSPSTLTRIKAFAAANPSANVIFNITTSAPLSVTVEEIINKVNANDSKIQDIKADIEVTSNADFLAPLTRLKIWQKGDKQKVEEVYPDSRVYIRPLLPPTDPSTFMDRTIVIYDSVNNTYGIRSKASGQTEEYPYEIDYIDYERGVILKTEYHLKENNLDTVQVKENSDFIEIGGIWGFQRETEKIYAEGELLYTTTSVYTNIRINEGISDAEFQ